MTTPSQYKLLPYEPTDQMIRRLPDWEQAVKDYKYMWENAPRVNVTPVKYEYRFKRDGSDHFGEWKECTKDLYERYQTNPLHFDGFLCEARALYATPSGCDLALAWGQGYRSGISVTCPPETGQLDTLAWIGTRTVYLDTVLC